MQQYYQGCEEYFRELEEKDFDSWFSKYYSALRPANQGWILDVGCGIGQVINRLAEENFRAIGIDISPIGVRKAARDGAGTFIIASATSLPFRDCSFESVGCCDFLEHTYHPDICLNEMVRVLRPGGKIVLVAPNFLRIIGLSPPYHWHMRGRKQKTLNLYNLLRKALISRILPSKMHFGFMDAQLEPHGAGGDVDAVCITNPIDIKFHLRKLGVNITYESAMPAPARPIVEKISEMPIIRTMAASTFLVCKKMPLSRRKEG